jgi:hypothetical protein
MWRRDSRLDPALRRRQDARHRVQVIFVSEEYALLRSLGLETQQQDLVDRDDGHSFDVLTVSNPKSKAVFKVWFGIDPITAAEMRHFQ